MTKRLKRGNLQVSQILVNFIENEALPDTNISTDIFWEKLETILDQFVPRNKELLQIRSDMKSKIDKFYLENSGKDVDHDEYVNFLKKINYKKYSLGLLRICNKKTNFFRSFCRYVFWHGKTGRNN